MPFHLIYNFTIFMHPAQSFLVAVFTSLKSIKIIWAVMTAFIAIIMMNVGNGADGLKIITNIGGLPAAVFLLFVAVSAVKVLLKHEPE